MEIIITIYLFILGLLIGSFLNVVIYRLNLSKGFIKGRSECLSCGHALSVKDLVPLFSFLLLKGKCRYCRAKISWQYFLVELVTGVCFVLLYINLFTDFVETRYIVSLQNHGMFLQNIGMSLQNIGMSLQNIGILIFYLIITCFLIIIFVYDLKHYLILDKITIPAIIIAIMGGWFLELGWLNMLVGAVIGGGLFLLQFVISKGKWVGGGDIRLGALMGVLLGWKLVLLGLFIAYLLGGVVGVFLLLKKKKDMKDAVPFGTFLTVATFITLLYGKIILDWYLNLLYL